MKVRQHLPFLFSLYQSKVLLMTSYEMMILCFIGQLLLMLKMIFYLLQHVVELYLTIRGFSATGAWMEHYKQCKISVTSGLRKGLKRTYAYTNTVDTT